MFFQLNSLFLGSARKLNIIRKGFEMISFAKEICAKIVLYGVLFLGLCFSIV